MAYVVDTNIHVFAADQRRYPLVPSSGKLPAWADGTHLTAEELLDHMQQAGVHQAALVHSSALYGYDNSYSLDSAERYPESFVSVGAIDTGADAAADSLSYLTDERGIGGVRLEREDGKDASEWLNSPSTTVLWGLAAKKHISVSLPSVRMNDLATVRLALERFPSVPVFLRRLADAPAEDGPPYEGAKELLDLSSFPNLYLTFSSHNIEAASKGESTPKEFFETFIERFGANRLMWASFFPANKAASGPPYKGMVDRTREDLSFLKESDRDALLGGSARSLFPSLSGAVA